MLEAKSPDQYGAAFAAMTKQRAEGLVLLGDIMFTRDSERLAARALSHKLPSVYLYKAFFLAGGLMAYGPDLRETVELALPYVDKILKGANPGDLPVQQPTRFKLYVNTETAMYVNTETANALGLTIPQSLLQRAEDKV